MKNVFSILLFIALSLCNAWADAIGSWKLYPCYNDITDIVPAGEKIYVLASGNLYSYNPSGSGYIETYTKNDVLNDNNISTIAWVKASKKLVIVYSNSSIDLLSQNGDVENISDLYNKVTTDDKTVNSIYVNGQYAYLATGFGIIKVDVKNTIITETYNLGFKVNYCYISNGYLYAASGSNGLMQCSLSGNLLNKNEWKRVDNYSANTKDTYIYDSTHNCYWSSDSDSKLVKYQKNTDGTFTAISTGVKPDGPAFHSIYRMCIADDKMYFVPGCHDVDVSWDYSGMVMSYDGNTWGKFGENGEAFSGHRYRNLNYVTVNPTDKSIVAVGAETGLYIFKDEVMIKAYDCSNSPIATALPTSSDPRKWSFVQSMAYDSNGNLWLSNYNNTNVICLTKDGEWKSFSHSDLLTSEYNYYIDYVVLDSRDLLWFCGTHWEDSRLYCYNTKTDKLKRYEEYVNQDGTKYYPYIKGLAEDKEGNIWMCSNQGPFYLQNSDITSGNDVFTQHKVPRNDGTNLADYLLSGINSPSITIDKANRKWFGTSDNGVYVISNDCNTQVAHFTKDNSPLPSNSVTDIKINDKTGVVYIATTGGLCSYNSGVTPATDGMSNDNIIAYPNPVTPNYTGSIRITGLSVDSQVKILSTSGQLINEGSCPDGLYSWDGCDLNGDRVASGVYMVNVATEDGKSGVVTKIAIIR